MKIITYHSGTFEPNSFCMKCFQISKCIMFWVWTPLSSHQKADKDLEKIKNGVCSVHLFNPLWKENTVTEMGSQMNSRYVIKFGLSEKHTKLNNSASNFSSFLHHLKPLPHMGRSWSKVPVCILQRRREVILLKVVSSFSSWLAYTQYSWT